jgi:hypothetical protein
MEHLTPETLARLVEDAPSPGERNHLEGCGLCRDEVAAIREQTRALARLPDLRPPPGDWEALERRLGDQGLLSRTANGGGMAFRRPGWLQIAAGFLLLVGGAGLGLGAGTLLDPAGRGTPGAPLAFGEGTPGASLPGAQAPGAAPDNSLLAALDPERGTPELSLEEAEELVRLTEGWYLTALTRYREKALEGDEPGAGLGDPLTRYAALEALMAASQAAVREVPTDPFLNGLLLNMRAEREASLQGLRAASTAHLWY